MGGRRGFPGRSYQRPTRQPCKLHLVFLFWSFVLHPGLFQYSGARSATRVPSISTIISITAYKRTLKILKPGEFCAGALFSSSSSPWDICFLFQCDYLLMITIHCSNVLYLRNCNLGRGTRAHEGVHILTPSYAATLDCTSHCVAEYNRSLALALALFLPPRPAIPP